MVLNNEKKEGMFMNALSGNHTSAYLCEITHFHVAEGLMRQNGAYRLVVTKGKVSELVDK
jgi:hypothetical protein